MSEYVGGETDSAVGRRTPAETHYSRATDLAREAVRHSPKRHCLVGLLTVLADAPRGDDALRGHRDLIDHWQHTSSWIQQ